MQVATLFRETAKLLGASMDGSGMDATKYCMKSESQADDGYETCVDAVCGGINPERLLGGPAHLDCGNMRHPGMGDHRQSISSMKMEQYGDPYSFVDEMPNAHITAPNINSNSNPSQIKKRGRRKKSESKREEMPEIRRSINGKEDVLMESKERKRQERFNGLSEEEVTQRTLPDHLSHNLDVVIIGINPGLFAAFKGHHYAGPGNHFWKCLYLSGLVPEPMTSDDDYNLLRYGIGFTNMVSRPTKGSADLTRREIKQGSQILLEKLQKYQPKVAVFNGKLIYEVFSGKKDFPFGRQADFVEGTNTYIWVMPSSSARCAQLPRAADKVPFYTALKKFRDYLNGIISDLDDSEVVFNETSKALKGTINESSKFLGPAASPYNEDTSGSTVPVKKKRGRPRKGMEKNSSPLNEANKAKRGKPVINSESKIAELERKCMEKVGNIGLLSGNGEKESQRGKTGRNVKEEVPRKRRGRPKKTRVLEESPPNRSMGSNTPDVLENSAPSSIGTCHTQTASSVSSGYSTATNISNEDRRREENGSLSNAGSGGPSPSHHSFTTQSDLSSEISAAISCGSAPSSPLNNQTENVFDGLSVVNHLREESQQAEHNSKLQMPTLQVNHNHSPANCNPPGNLYSSPGLNPHPQSVDSHESSYIPFHHAYDNRLHTLNSTRSQNYHPPQMSRGKYDGGNDGGMQPRSSYHSPYETKSLDVASKSLSGLESLVDQIPSIADSEVGGPSVSSGVCLTGLVSDSISHSQSMCALPNVTSSMSNSGHGHYGEVPSGFLPYGHGTPSSYPTSSHYTSSPPYYPSELGSSFPVNTLAPTYCSPPPSSGIMFGYPSYHGQYGSPSTAGYPHSASAGLHLPPSSYTSSSSYSSAYPGPTSYPHGHPMTASNGAGGQRFTQRLHLRQEGMDLGHMGFGGF